MQYLSLLRVCVLAALALSCVRVACASEASSELEVGVASEVEWVTPMLVETLSLASADAEVDASQVPGTQKASFTDRAAAWFNGFAEKHKIGGPGAQSWDDFNNRRVCLVTLPLTWSKAASVVSIPVATIERATNGVPALTAKNVGQAIYDKYINMACGPSTDYRGLTMMGYDMQRIASLGQWLQRHPFLAGVMGTLPNRISAWINKQPGLIGATRMGPVYTNLMDWYRAVAPEIQAGRPALTLLGFTAAGMHYVNVVGFRFTDASRQVIREVGVLDPNDPALIKLVPATLWDGIMKGPMYIPNVVLGPTTMFYNRNPNPMAAAPVMPPPVMRFAVADLDSASDAGVDQ